MFRFTSRVATMSARVAAVPRHTQFAIATGTLTATAFFISSAFAEPKAAAPVEGLSKKEFRPFTLKSVTQCNHNTKVFTFDVSGSGDVPVASFILSKGDENCKTDDGKPVVRPYTPLDQTEDTLTLLIKKYPGSKYGSYIFDCKEGDEVLLKGFMTKYKYEANSKKEIREIALIAGGSGITPMLQIAKKILNNSKDNTKVTLLFANRAEEDILLKETLDDLAYKYNSFDVVYILSQPSGEWPAEYTGRINTDMAKRHLPKPDGGDAMVFVCGPGGMYETVSGKKAGRKQGELKGILKELGFTEDQVFKL